VPSAVPHHEWTAGKQIMSIATDPTTEQLIAELHKIDGKAEIVDGRIVCMSPTGQIPGRASSKIYNSLLRNEKQFGGYAYPDNVAFLVDLPNRKSFAPDAAFSTEPPTMAFGKRAPEFAVEVRSEGDYGPAAEREIAVKRSDYFAAGTKVVWDVDLLSDDVVRVYRAELPNEPTIYRRGETAEAEPAVLGWTFPVDELFD
jgi:Uma2 family endonuclease